MKQKNIEAKRWMLANWLDSVTEDDGILCLTTMAENYAAVAGSEVSEELFEIASDVSDQLIDEGLLDEDLRMN